MKNQKKFYKMINKIIIIYKVVIKILQIVHCLIYFNNKISKKIKDYSYLNIELIIFIFLLYYQLWIY